MCSHATRSRPLTDWPDRLLPVLIPLEGGPVDSIRKAHPYFSRAVIPEKTYGRGMIPAGTYKGVGDTPTLEVGAQLVIRSDVDEELVYK